MLNLNRCTLAGRLGKDPEVRQTAGGKQVTTFSLCTNYNYKQGDDWKTVSTWHNIVAWGQQSEIAAELTKGDAVFVEGRIQTREWEDRDGNKRTTTEVVAFLCQKLAAAPSKQREEKPKESVPKQRQHEQSPPEDQIPF